MPKIKILLAALISLLPFNFLRVLGYRLLGYKISGRIGFGTIIAVSSAQIEETKIGAFNLFIGPMRVDIGKSASIGSLNTFSCGFWTMQPQHAGRDYARALTLSAKSLITSRHYFDVAGAFKLGEGSWVAGVESQFWTHGAGAHERDISIGRDCYIGSAVRFAPNTQIGDNVIVALGSVVTKKFEASNAMIGGVPAIIIKENYDWKRENESA